MLAETNPLYLVSISSDIVIAKIRKLASRHQMDEKKMITLICDKAM